MGKAVERQATSKYGNILHMIYRDYTMLIILVIFMILGSILSPVFLTVHNIMNIFRQNAVTGIVALGVTFVILGGTFDMSVGSTISLTGILAIILQESVGVLPAMLIAVAVGILIGFVNGSIIASIKGGAGDSFMITFGMLTLIQGLALITTNGNTVSGSNSPFYLFLGDGNLGVFPFSFLLFLVFALIIWVILAKTKKGREIYYMGANPEAARLSGIHIKRLRTTVYMVSGGMTAFAAILLTGRTNGTTPIAGQNMEFDAVTAIVVGGVGISGGDGSVIQVVIGVLIMGVIGNILNIIGVSSQNQLVVRGIILILAVVLDNMKKKKA